MALPSTDVKVVAERIVMHEYSGRSTLTMLEVIKLVEDAIRPFYEEKTPTPP